LGLPKTKTARLLALAVLVGFVKVSLAGPVRQVAVEVKEKPEQKGDLHAAHFAH
jgi:hypothetical protein